MSRIAAVWFPNWPIQRLVVSQPALRKQQVILFYRDARRGQLVSAASPLAMQAGVAVGMPLSEAKSLFRRSKKRNSQSAAKVHIFEHQIDKDRIALEALCDQLESFSPIMGLETITAEDSKRGQQPAALLLDITGLAHLFGDEPQLARQLILTIETMGYLPRVAVADTVGAAWALARQFAGPYFRQHQQPLVLDPGDRQTLSRLPIDTLRLEEPIVNTLYQLGIRTVEQLTRLSRNDLAMRFGNVIHRRLDQLWGTIEEPVVGRRKPTQLLAQQWLEFPTHHRETIEVVIGRLIADLCEQMRGQQQGALEWKVRLACQEGQPIEFFVRLFQPSATIDHVMPLIEMQLEQALSPVTRKGHRRNKNKTGKPRSPGQIASTTETSLAPEPFHRYTTVEVTEISVAVTSHVLLAQQQRNLFDENPRLDRQAMAQLINRLASRLGDRNVVYPTLQSGAQPEYSFQLKPLVDLKRKRRPKTSLTKKQSHVLGRPLRLFHPPLPLTPIGDPLPAESSTETSAQSGVDPMTLKLRQGQERPPARLVVRGQSMNFSGEPWQVVAACGPERIETGWWRGRTVCRDYWRIETGRGQQWWIYRDLRTQGWWLHGEF